MICFILKYDNNKEHMVQRGENKPLFRKHNVLSVRISELRELFPNANIVRMIKLMPSLLSNDIHEQLVNKRYLLDRSLSNFDIDKLITNHPFILCKDSDFIGRNKDNLMELFEINETQFKIMIDAQPQLIMFDARRTISVKYQLIAQYFQTRIQNQIEILYKSYNDLHSDIDSDDDHDINDKDTDNPSTFEQNYEFEIPKNKKSLKYLKSKINKEEKEKLKWTIIRNPEILMLEWNVFGRLEFVGNNKSLSDKKFAVNRLLELESTRILKKFPEYSKYIMDRLEIDGGCDRDKLKPLSITDLEEAMGELIALEHYPRSSEIDEHLLDDEHDEDQSDEDEQEELQTK